VSNQAKPERRTQAERTASTRAALLDAAVECLAELGYSGTTTTEVARRAGVSRGAQLHHFPSKADLLLAATAELCHRRLDEFRKAYADAPPGTDRVDRAIDVMWSLYAGGTFVSHVELLVAARTDESLRKAVLEQQQRFFDGAAAISDEIWSDSLAADPSLSRLSLAFTFALLDGVALSSLLGVPPVPPDDVIDALKAVGHLVIPVNPEEPA
jgi:AcrR family transcriptional regulator